MVEDEFLVGQVRQGSYFFGDHGDRRRFHLKDPGEGTKQKIE